MEEDKSKFAVYFNDEYIGEAESFEVKKGGWQNIEDTEHKAEVMPILKIKGDYQASSQ